MKLVSLLNLSALTLTLVLASCKKDETDNLSRVKTYPAISLTGDAVTSVNLNSPYTDPGAVTTLGTETVNTIVSGAVNTSQVGAYNIIYRGANAEGDTVSAARLVFVVDPAVNNVDQSGAFVRSGNPVNITRIGNGLYRINNLGGVAATSTAFFPAYFAQLTPTRLSFPRQTVSGAGSVGFTSLTSTFDSSGLLTSFAYAVDQPSIFATNVRTFTRL